MRHILIDEYQDTNVVQHALLKAMALENNILMMDSVCVVGDEDQSIYSWRGATVANMQNFTKDFSPTTIIKIEQNYRSAQPILDIANAVIKNNVQRNQKTLWSNKHEKNCALVFVCHSEYQESDAIVYTITTTKKYYSQNSIAILYRTHTQSRVIEEMLIK